MDYQVFKIIVPKWTYVDQMLVANTFILLPREISKDIEKQVFHILLLRKISSDIKKGINFFIISFFAYCTRVIYSQQK
jgi:hypothetical protein